MIITLNNGAKIDTEKALEYAKEGLSLVEVSRKMQISDMTLTKYLKIEAPSVHAILKQNGIAKKSAMMRRINQMQLGRKK
jgi:hypothetical protein